MATSAILRYNMNKIMCYLDHARVAQCSASSGFNPILHTAWLESHALTLKNNTAEYYFGEKSSFLHTFLKFSPQSRKIQVNF